MAKKKSQIRHLYIQGPKWPKNTKIPKNPKNSRKVTKVSLFWCLSDWELKCFWLGGVGDQKSQFWQISKFWPKKKSQIRHLYIQGQKWPKNTKILKSAINGQIVTKVSFFWCLSNWELKCEWLGGLGDQKSRFSQNSKF